MVIEEILVLGLILILFPSPGKGKSCTNLGHTKNNLVMTIAHLDSPSWILNACRWKYDYKIISKTLRQRASHYLPILFVNFTKEELCIARSRFNTNEASGSLGMPVEAVEMVIARMNLADFADQKKKQVLASIYRVTHCIRNHLLNIWGFGWI